MAGFHKSLQTDLLTPQKELEMGDKGGKKDKEKNKKQMAQKHAQKVKETKDKQPKKVEK